MKKLLATLLTHVAIMACVNGQSKIYGQIEKNLASKKISVTQVLTNFSYMRFHSDKSFRELIKKYAKQEKIGMVGPEEPGKQIVIKGKVTDRNHNLLSNRLIYVYQTDNKGWYSDTAGHISGMEGDRSHARLFGYLRTKNNGSFEFNTIQPQGYPRSELPRHIHLEVLSNDGKVLLITELLFDDDKRLTPAVRVHMTQEDVYVAANKGSGNVPLYNYEIVVKK